MDALNYSNQIVRFLSGNQKDTLEIEVVEEISAPELDQLISAIDLLCKSYATNPVVASRVCLIKSLSRKKLSLQSARQSVRDWTASQAHSLVV